MSAKDRAVMKAGLRSFSAIAVVICGIQWLFEPSQSTWSSPWMWGPMLFLWIVFFNDAYPIVLQEDVLDTLDKSRDDTHSDVLDRLDRRS